MCQPKPKGNINYFQVALHCIALLQLETGVREQGFNKVYQCHLYMCPSRYQICTALFKACRILRGCHGNPMFWQICQPYLNQGGQNMPSKLLLPPVFSDLPTALYFFATPATISIVFSMSAGIALLHTLSISEIMGRNHF